MSHHQNKLARSFIKISVPRYASFTIMPIKTRLRTSSSPDTSMSQEQDEDNADVPSIPDAQQNSSLSFHSSDEINSDDNDNWSQRPIVKEKRVCLSCGARRSPRWHKSRFLCHQSREVFCNACAIRIKKYHLICSSCHYAMNKEQEVLGVCPRCKRSFINMINETEVRMDAYTNQLDSILAGAISLFICNKHQRIHHSHPHHF